MSNLSQFLGGSSGSSGGGGGGGDHYSSDPYERAAWCIFSANHTTYRGYYIYNHYNRPITTFTNNNNDGFTGYGGTEVSEGMNTFINCGSHSGSSSASHGSNSVSGGTGDIGSISPNGTSGYMGTHALDHPYHVMSANANSCCWVGNTDPQRRMFRRAQNVWAGGRSPMEGSTYAVSANASSYRNSAKDSKQGWYFGSSVSATNRFGWNTSTNDSRGSMGYNQRTKVMVFVDRLNDSTNRWHWYKDVPPPNPEVDWNWWRENVKESNHRWTDVPYQIYDGEDRVRKVITVCDTGEVYACYMRPHQGQYIQAINFTNETYGTNTDCGYTFRKELDAQGNRNTTDVNSIKSSMNSTTTYGIPSNEWHGLQFQITNDGRYVMTMSPYYYYGSGMKMYVIDSVTGEYRRGWNNSTGYSMCVAPFGANDITFNYNHNSDSITTRVSAGRMSFEENFHSYKLDNYNQGGNGIAYGPTDGGTLIGNFGYHNGMFDITQHTTQYPRLYQVIPGALTIAEVEAYRGPAINDWSKPQNSGFEYSDPTTWNAVNPPESGW